MNSPGRRLIRLEAIAAAKKLHRELDLERSTVEGDGQVDVFGTIEQLGIPLIFRPLEAALGLYLSAPDRGIMVTTQRSRQIQRFTGAHELGHAVLNHSGSVDIDWSVSGGLPASQPVTREGRPRVGPVSDQEIAADAFAAEFLLPRWLYVHHVRSQGWTIKSDLTRPEVLYQLALRMGASFEATCRGLESHEILGHTAVERLLDTEIAGLKRAVGENHRPGNAWADAWRVTEKDANKKLLGNPDDLIRLDLQEAVSSGFRWDVSELPRNGFEIVHDQVVEENGPIRYGAPVTRTVILRPLAAAANVTLDLHEIQPWRGPRVGDPHFELSLSLLGREAKGLSRGAKIRKVVG